MISRRKRFPTLQEFKAWSFDKGAVSGEDIYNYFSNTNRVEMPEVGQEYEFSVDGENWFKTKLKAFMVSPVYRNSNIESIASHIRPITTPTRDEVLAKCKALGLTDAELEALK